MTDPAEPDIKVVDRRWWAQQGQTPDTAGANGDAARNPDKPSYVEDLERQLSDKDRQLQELLGKYRDAAREFDDTRVRLRKDVARDVERGRRTMLLEFLEVLDNLDRAIDAAKRASSPDPMVSGVEMVRRLFLAKLEGFGVARIDPVGQPFDPARHEAVVSVPTSDATQDGIVQGLLTPGYAMGDDVLRPALVAVTQLDGTRRN